MRGWRGGRPRWCSAQHTLKQASVARLKQSRQVSTLSAATGLNEDNEG
jgi:hypothetical protein